MVFSIYIVYETCWLGMVVVVTSVKQSYQWGYVNTCVYVCEGVWERVFIRLCSRLLDKLWMFCNRNCCDWMIIIRISSLSLNLRAIDWAHISAKVNMVVIICLGYTKVCALWMLLVAIVTVFHYASKIVPLTCECTNNRKHSPTFTGQK